MTPGRILGGACLITLLCQGTVGVGATEDKTARERRQGEGASEGPAAGAADRGGTTFHTVVTAARRLPSSPVAGSSVELLPEATLKAFSPLTLGEALEGFGGILVLRTGTTGDAESFRIRGGEPDRVLLVVDGIRWNDLHRGIPLSTLVPLDDTALVEILRGPAGSAFGPTGADGVIVLTPVPPGNGPEAGLSLRYGSLGTLQSSGHLGHGSDRAFVRASLNLLEQEGRPALHEGYEAGSAALRGGVRVGGRTHLWTSLLGARSVKENYYFDAGPSPGSGAEAALVRDRNRETETATGAAAIALRHAATAGWDFLVRATVRTGTLLDANPRGGTEAAVDPRRGIFEDFRMDVDQTELAVETLHHLAHRLGPLSGGALLGADARREQARSAASLTLGPEATVSTSLEGERTTLGLQFREEVRLPHGLSAEAGVRLDGSDSYGTVVTRRAGAALDLPLGATDAAPVTRVRVAWAEGFKAPSFVELHHPLYGNPDLRPERSDTVEAALEERFPEEAAEAFVVLFRTDYSDLIERKPGRAENTASARILGVETGLRIRPLPALTARGFATVLDARDRGGEPLPERPAVQATGEVAWSLSPWSPVTLRLRAVHVGERRFGARIEGIDGRVSDTAAAFTRLDLAAEVRLPPGSAATRPFGGDLRLDLGLQNVTDARVVMVPGLPEPGMTFLLGLTAGAGQEVGPGGQIPGYSM